MRRPNFPRSRRVRPLLYLRRAGHDTGAPQGLTRHPPSLSLSNLARQNRFVESYRLRYDHRFGKRGFC